MSVGAQCDGLRRAIGALLTACALLVIGLAGTAQGQPKFPALTGRIVDEAGLIPPQDRTELTASLEALERKASDQLVVVTLKSLQGYSIEDFGYQLGRAWKIGQGTTNNGVLLIVAPNERKVRIEVGRGLEPQLTDAISALIVQNGILPAFRRGDFVGGIKAGVRDISDTLLGDAEAVKDRLAKKAPKPPESDPEVIFFLMIWVAIAIFVMYSHYRQSHLPPGARRRSGYGSGSSGPIFVPGSWGGGSGSWGGSGGGSGDGGFSGGGGDFGGGGSSGSW